MEDFPVGVRYGFLFKEKSESGFVVTSRENGGAIGGQ
jgi:hypothetical protein